MTAAQWTAYILAFLAMNLRVISMSIDSKVRPTGSHTYIILLSVKNILLRFMFHQGKQRLPTTPTPLVTRGCSILRPFGQQLSHYIFSKLKLSNPKFKNIIKFSSAAKKFEETYETKVSSTQKIKMQNAMMTKKSAKIPFFSFSKKLKIT